MEKTYFGIMLDCSRNAVYTVASVKRLMDYMAKMGYNMLMLYTEDTYEVEGQPLFGYMRGRYSIGEMKELVAYGEEKGIELIPCIQTLAHLNQIFKWDVYQKMRDCNDILLIDDERTYQLIDDMLRTLRSVFKTKKVHIGMDEAHNVGLGKYLDQHGFENRFSLLSRHMDKVKALCEKHHFEPMIWSDMFFRLANHGAYYTEQPGLITQQIVDSVPEGIDLVYWDYYHLTRDVYDVMLSEHKKFNRPVWFAGGAWTWTGYTPHNRFSIEASKSAIAACRDADVKNVLITCWGDNGGETSIFSVLPALYYTALLYYGNTDETAIKQGFAETFGMAFDDFMLLDLPSSYADKETLTYQNPDKLLLYKDPFLPVMGPDVPTDGSINRCFADFGKALRKQEDHAEFGYLFRVLANLCDGVAVNAGLAERLRQAYQSGDRQQLQNIVAELAKMEELVENFYKAYRSCWLHEKKGHGFDVQDIRLGGLKMRYRSCRERLSAYLAGEIAAIEELEEQAVSLDVNFRMKWSDLSPNAI